MATAPTKGYDCEFISKVPNEYKCPKCKHVLRDPHRVSCCDEEYCKTCITPFLRNKKPCPQCGKRNEITECKKTKRYIDQLRCRCSNQREGCGWEGKLYELDGHLNQNPTNENQLNGCNYAKLQCQHCGKKLPRNEIHEHQENVCQDRPYDCQYCNYHGTYQHVMTIHLPECQQQPVECPQGCGLSPERKILAAHKANECPMTTIKCEFPGCEEKRQRKDMPAHREEYLVHHMQLLLQMVQELQAEKRQREEGEQQRREEEKAQQLPTTVKMTDVHQHLVTKKEWTSPLFYTHERGYAIQLQVYVAGYGIAGFRNEISVQVHVIRGQYDDQLQWPCQISIEATLINQEQDGENVTKIANIRARKNDQNRSERWMMFIGEKNARHRFIKDNYLQFKISKIN